MAKTSSVFVVDFGDYYQEVRGAFTSLDAAKDFVLSDVLLDVLSGEEYLDSLTAVINEYRGDKLINTFNVSCQGFDFSIGKVTNRNKWHSVQTVGANADLGNVAPGCATGCASAPPTPRSPDREDRACSSCVPWWAKRI